MTFRVSTEKCQAVGKDDADIAWCFVAAGNQESMKEDNISLCVQGNSCP